MESGFCCVVSCFFSEIESCPFSLSNDFGAPWWSYRGNAVLLFLTSTISGNFTFW